MDSLPWVDRAGLVLAHDWRSPVLDVFFGGITWLGSQALLLPAAALAAILLWRRGRGPDAQFLLLACYGAPLIGQLLKGVVGLSRPNLYPALVDVHSPLSFPSVHAMQITAAGLALLLILRSKTSALMPLLLLSLVVGLVALSRVYLQVHYPSDVLAGVLLAAGWTWGLRQITI